MDLDRLYFICFLTGPRGKYYFHFTDGATDTQRGVGICPSSGAEGGRPGACEDCGHQRFKNLSPWPQFLLGKVDSYGLPVVSNGRFRVHGKNLMIPSPCSFSVLLILFDQAVLSILEPLPWPDLGLRASRGWTQSGF